MSLPSYKQEAHNQEAQKLAMNSNTGQVEETNTDVLNVSLDVTVVQEESMDESHGTEDLQVTLQEAMALRKNLEQKFEEELADFKQPSIREKIAHFEKKASENRCTVREELKKPPSTILTTKDTTPSTDRLKVFLRVRPCVNDVPSTIEILASPDGKSMPTTIRTHPPEASNAAKTDRSRAKVNDPNAEAHSIKEYEFTSVLGPETSQYTVFEKTAAPLVHGLCRANTIGKSALLFCYGITNAGKTHTVLGDPRKQESWGIIPRCLSAVMQKVENTDMDAYLSCFEIYNEQLLDLLPIASEDHAQRFASSSASLKIREGPCGQMIIPGLAEYKVDSMKTGLPLIRRAKEARHTAPNHLNGQSSRSHSICQITIRKQKESSRSAKYNLENDNETPVEEAHLWIVDLAGNERSKRTNAGSLRQKEATYINMSLMNLMRCLTSTQKPYRDSKLTLLFMHHWGIPGNSTTMVVNVHGAASDYDETQHVLSYAISSKSIPVVAIKTHGTDKNAPHYDLDGRRKGTKPLTMVQKAAKALRKLSPKRVMPTRKRKNPAAPTVAHEKSLQTLPNELPVTKKACLDFGDASVNSSSRELASLRMQLSVARAEIQGLETKNRELTLQLETVETAIRDEVSQEMLREMIDMRRRYENTINDLVDKTEQDQESALLERAESKIDELVEKVEECEEEMSRMSRMHCAELKAAEEEYRTVLSEKDEEIKKLQQRLAETINNQQTGSSESNAQELSELKIQLAASRAEVERLKRSKEELVQNYEQLLTGEELEEESEDDDDETQKAQKFDVALSVAHGSRIDVKENMPKAEKAISVEKPKSWRKDCLGRQPFAHVTENQKEDIDSDDDSSFDTQQWLLPRKPTEKNPKTGLFPRPPGRAPASTDGWDAKRGAWRLSNVNQL